MPHVPDPDPRDPHRIDLPFETSPPGATLDLSDGLAASGLVIVASVWQDPETHEKLPCLVYRFANPDGSGFYPPIGLVLNERDMTTVKLLTSQTANAAIRAARQ